MSQLSIVHISGSKKTNAVPQCVQGLRHRLAAIADSAVTIGHNPFFYTFHWHRCEEITGGGQLRKQSITWKDTGCAKSLLISHGIHRLRRFAFQVNGDHGSLQGWDEYSTRAGDAGVVTTILWCRQLAQQSGGAQLFSIIDHRLVQYSGLYRSRSAHSRTICRSLCLIKRAYTGNNNNIIHTVHVVCHLREGSFDQRGRLTRGAFYPGGFWLGWPKNRGHLTAGQLTGGHLTVHRNGRLCILSSVLIDFTNKHLPLTLDDVDLAQRATGDFFDSVWMMIVVDWKNDIKKVKIQQNLWRLGENRNKKTGNVYYNSTVQRCIKTCWSQNDTKLHKTLYNIK